MLLSGMLRHSAAIELQVLPRGDYQRLANYSVGLVVVGRVA
jgi:hypothetical protein